MKWHHTTAMSHSDLIYVWVTWMSCGISCVILFDTYITFIIKALHYLVEKRKSLPAGVWLVFGFPWTMTNWQHHYFENQYYIYIFG